MTERSPRMGISVLPTGRAVVAAADGIIHIERDEGTTFCGLPVEAYAMRWDVRTIIVCGPCLTAAGVRRIPTGVVGTNDPSPNEERDLSPG